MDNFNFNRDFFEGCAALGDKDGAALAWALLKYGYSGEEPNGLKPTAKAAFAFARGRIDAMVHGSGGMPGRPKKSEKPKTPSRGVSEKKPKTPSRGVSEKSAPENGETPRGQKEKEKEKEKEIASAISYAPALAEARTFEAEPPSLDDVRVYFACNCLKGNPEEFHDHFAAQGWVRSNGQAIADWRAQARQWSRKQAEFDQSKPADLREPEAPMPMAENAVDWEAELAKLEDDGWSA